MSLSDTAWSSGQGSMEKPVAKFRILVVDDDALIRDYVAGLLLSSGYHVTGAASGREALGLIEAGLAVDLLFTDVSIGGGMNGIELARAAQLVLPELKVLFFSGDASATGKQDLPASADFLQKPFRKVQCTEKVRSVLAGSTTER